MSEIVVKPYDASYREEVIAHILAIQQQEFNIAISRADQPDLEKIEIFYQRGDGNFWLACHEGTVVGTVALIDIGDRRAALRKMFVAAPFRGCEHSAASRLLATVLDWAKARSLQEIYLGTTDRFVAAHRFYEKNGFTRAEKIDLPTEFPLMAVDSIFYKYDVI